MTLEQVIEKAVRTLLIDHTNAEHPEYIATAVREWYEEQGFSIKIKLKDPESCEGCWLIKRGVAPRLYSPIRSYYKEHFYCRYIHRKRATLKRPNRCIEENGR
jgi:hypothetical protein